MGLDGFVRDNSILPCHCAGLCFIVKDYGRILVGDLRIINSNQIPDEETFNKGTKLYREYVCKLETRADLILGLTVCLDNWCNKHSIYKSSFSEWKQKVLKLVYDMELPRQPNTVLPKY